MNKLTIIGNLTRDPELRTTSAGINVCDFTVAVNKRQRRDQSSQPEADFFKVSVWRERADVCAKYLAKGRKVCVIGPVSVRTYTTNDGETRAQLEVTGEEVEFLSSGNENVSTQTYSQPAAQPRRDPETHYEQVAMDDELPF